MLKAFIKIEAGFSILRGGVSTVVNLSKAWEAVGREARAAAAAQAAGVAASSGGSVLAMLARLGPYGLVAAAIAAAAYGTYSLGTSGPQRDADRAEKETEEFAERHASAQAISDRRIASMAQLPKERQRNSDMPIRCERRSENRQPPIRPNTLDRIIGARGASGCVPHEDVTRSGGG